MGVALIMAFSPFVRAIVGLITRPYETVRGVVDHGSFFELVYVAMLLTAYFVLASLVKVARFRPFLLTREFVVLAAATLLTYVFCVALFWVAGRLVWAQGKLKGLAVAWGYSLIPTLVWFLATSILYVLLPPPRTASIQGVLFSILFLIFSATLFFWKITIGYLSLRFGLRLGLGKILIVLAIAIPVLAGYSFGMYRLGIFKIPFL